MNLVSPALLLVTTLTLPPGHPGADTTTVTVSGPPLWGSEVRVVEELRIGTLDGPVEEAFGRIGTIAVHPSGVMAVADLQGPVIRLFDGEGRYLGDLGRAGEGPGEYRQLLGLEVHPEGFAIWDAGNGRLSVYDPQGDVLRSSPVPSGLFTGDAFHVDRRGWGYVKASGGSTGVQWLVIDAAGEVQGRIDVPDDDPATPTFQISSPEGALYPFTVRTHAALDREGRVVEGRSDAYRFVRSGGAQRSDAAEAEPVALVREWTPVPVPRAERAQWRAWADFFASRAGGSAAPVPATKPAFHGFWIDDDGRLWVRRHVPAQELDDPLPPLEGRPELTWREPAVFDVIAADGTFVGTVQLPLGVRIHGARGDRVWATDRGEFGERYVVRYRVVR